MRAPMRRFVLIALAHSFSSPAVRLCGSAQKIGCQREPFATTSPSQ
jgi:hypothetical protein